MIEHTWARIEVAGVPLDVSADAARIGGVRVALTWTEAEAMARELGGELPTPAVLDARYRAARYKTLPAPGPVTTRTAEQHSADIDRQLLAMGYFEGIVGNVGKHWCRAGGPDEAPLYGWHVETNGKRWRKIPLHPCASGIPGLKVIQPHARRVHNRQHRDYAMTGVFVRRVPTTAGPAPAGGATVLPAPPAGDGVEPSTLLSREPGYSLGERCLAWSLAEQTADAGRLTSAARVAAYLRPCLRRQDDGREALLWPPRADGTPSTPRGNCCAAAACAAERAALLLGEMSTLPYRASGLELQRDALALGLWRPLAAVLDGSYWPALGDLMIIQRGKPGDWERHVCRVAGLSNLLGRPQPSLDCLGANEGGGYWQLSRRLLAPPVLGLVELPRRVEPRPALDPAEAGRLWALADDVTFGRGIGPIEALARIDEREGRG